MPQPPFGKNVYTVTNPHQILQSGTKSTIYRYLIAILTFIKQSSPS